MSGIGIIINKSHVRINEREASILTNSNKHRGGAEEVGIQKNNFSAICQKRINTIGDETSKFLFFIKIF